MVGRGRERVGEEKRWEGEGGSGRGEGTRCERVRVCMREESKCEGSELCYHET